MHDSFPKLANTTLCIGLIMVLCSPVVLQGAAAESPVADAAMRGDATLVRSLLSAGADVNVPQGDGMTALHWAAVNNTPGLAEMLIYAGAHLEAGTRIGNYTPLHLASKEGNSPVAEMLLEAGSDAVIALLLEHGGKVNATGAAWGQTPLMFAAATNRTAAVRLLLDHGADTSIAATVVDVVAREKADNDFMRRRRQERAAIRSLDQREEEQQRRAQGGGAEGEELGGGEEAKGNAEGKIAGKDEKEAGGEAVGPKKPQLGSKTTEEKVVDEQVVDKKVEEQKPPTFEKSEKVEEAKKKETVKEALAEEESGGKVPESEEEKGSEEPVVREEGEEDEDKEPERPPTYGELVGGHGGLTALLYAAREGHEETALALLEAGADINRVSGGDHTSPLLIAILNGHFDLAMALLERGADPNLASDAQTTPLYGVLNVRWAPRSAYPQQNAYKQQETGYLKLMRTLLEAGADPNTRLDKHLWYTSFNFDQQLYSAGATPFWRAAYAQDIVAMRLLVAYGADPDIPTRKVPRRRRARPQGEDGKAEEKEDPSGLPEIPVGGPAVHPLHAASGAGYGEGFAGYAHQHVPGGWMPAVKYIVEELGADVNIRDQNAYTPLHHVAARGDFEMVLYLVLKGADPTVVSRRGQSTADMANGPVQRIQPFPKTLKLLELLGAKNNDNCVSC